MATWNHIELRRYPDRRGGSNVTIEFTRSTGEKRICTFWSLSDTGLSVAIVNKKTGYELGWSELNRFDIGEDSKEILIKLIKAIRQNPDLTITQATDWYDVNYSDALYKGSQLLLRMRDWIKDEYGVIPSWNQFKTYVQNNVFEEVD